MPLRRIVGIRNGARCRPVLGRPLVRTGWALHQLPLMAEQVFQVVVAPLRRRLAPNDLQAAADRVVAVAAAIAALPTQALLLDGRAFGFGADILERIGSAVCFAERVPAGNESNCLLV